MRGGEEGRSGEAEMQKNAVIAFGFGSLYVYFSCAAPWAPVHYMRFCGSLISSHINTTTKYLRRELLKLSLVGAEKEKNREFNEIYKIYNFHQHLKNIYKTPALILQICVMHILVIWLGYTLNSYDHKVAFIHDDGIEEHARDHGIIVEEWFQTCVLSVSYWLMPVPLFYVVFLSFSRRVDNSSSADGGAAKRVEYFEKVMCSVYFLNALGFILLMFFMAWAYASTYALCNEFVHEVFLHCMDEHNHGKSMFAPSSESSPQTIIHLHMIFFALMHEDPFMELHDFLNIARFKFWGMIVAWVGVDAYYGVPWQSKLFPILLSWLGMR